MPETALEQRRRAEIEGSTEQHMQSGGFDEVTFAALEGSPPTSE
jgi:hypothetical protein